MEKLDKTKIITIGIAALLVLVLAIVMICGACSGKQDAEWNPLTTAGTTDTTGESTDDTAQNQTGSTTDVVPEVSIGVIEKDQLDEILNQPPKPTKPTTGGNTGATQNQPTTQPTTKPTEATEPSQETENTTPGTDEVKLLSWEEWSALSRAEKIAYRDSFPSNDAYYQWYDDAKAQYDSTKPVTDGNIDLGGNN